MSFHKNNGCQSVIHTAKGQSCVYYSISFVMPFSRPLMPVFKRRAQNLIDKKCILTIFSSSSTVSQPMFGKKKFFSLLNVRNILICIGCKVLTISIDKTDKYHK